MVDSEIPKNLSTGHGYLHSFECSGWYEIVSLSNFISFFRKNQNAKFDEWWRRGVYLYQEPNFVGKKIYTMNMTCEVYCYLT